MTYQCPFCTARGSLAPTEKRLRSHITRWHADLQPRACTICGLVMASSAQLAGHSSHCGRAAGDAVHVAAVEAAAAAAEAGDGKAMAMAVGDDGDGAVLGDDLGGAAGAAADAAAGGDDGVAAIASDPPAPMGRAREISAPTVMRV
jgi:hypothetical protein